METIKEKLSNGNTIKYVKLDNGTCYHVLIEGKKNIAVTIRRAR